jgi:hypothetical protein
MDNELNFLLNKDAKNTLNPNEEGENSLSFGSDNEEANNNNDGDDWNENNDENWDEDKSTQNDDISVFSEE